MRPGAGDFGRILDFIHSGFIINLDMEKINCYLREIGRLFLFFDK
jgi:hypothetical protein